MTEDAVAPGEVPPAAAFLPRFLAAAAVFLVLRIPSFLEPHWYTDEAGYATAARSVLRGQVLYLQVWTNKPPLQIWTIAATIRLFGPTEWGLHLLTSLFGLIALGALAYAGTRLLSPWRATVAVLLAAVLLGAPFLGSELAIPENLLIAPTSWAGALLLTRVRGNGRWWPIGVGLLVAAAIAYQQTAIADGAAFAAIIAFAAARPLRPLLLYAGTVLVATAAWLIPAVALAGADRVAFALVGFYVAFTADALPESRSGQLLHAALLPLATGAALVGAYLGRRGPVAGWASWLWAVAVGLIAAAANQPFAHYLIPAVIPASLALASLRLRVRGRSPRQWAGSGATLAAVLVTLAMASVVTQDWMIQERWLGPYYGGFASVVAGRESLTAWQDSFDARVPADRAVAVWIRGHGLEGTRTVVWSADAWPYLLADLPVLLPTAPIYNDQVLYGEHGPVAARVAELAPTVIITSSYDTAQFPEIWPLLRTHYHPVFRSGVDTVWLRNGTALPSG